MALSRLRQCLIWKLANGEFTVSERWKLAGSAQNRKIIPFSERAAKNPNFRK
jgi:hypothetical protein